MDYEIFKERDISKKEAVELLKNPENFYDTLKLADDLRKNICGDVVTYVNNANIYYTNMCEGNCKFCAFPHEKGVIDKYYMTPSEIAEKALWAKNNGATEVTLMGGVIREIDTYMQAEIIKKIIEKTGYIDTHAYSPYEILIGAESAGLDIKEAVAVLKEAGLHTVPGAAAEILDDEVRQVICPNKICVKDWVKVIKELHKQGIKTSSTIMYGHVEKPEHIVNHLFLIKEIQEETKGFTEMILMSYLHKNTPLYASGIVSGGASGDYDLLVTALSRIILKDTIPNIQAPWVKLGIKLTQLSLHCGANDVGGTLMGDEVSEAAGADEVSMTKEELRNAILAVHKVPKERSTLYDILD
ncbi:5-amino-6-(D-ribitylamino)uracil--L-tyrosine 4-hydroxyphenyl transferase CofH [Methanococcus voltae]|uniref:5-amino-6-(D-ribitylamino)uracil--L-tyrosine 4-hydroxyphenyl transferase n=1 Tax=Methanococcus voltae (strain ATCC BAA-1334 / A3) TaxID=456320 RepID=D7DV71_METV3|nr:5-amino-6-(D-ribitylamino)uracil--L-tyrosine 4-hydroxyphenyl transferase CofH [Methanococcus voltae]MCS3901926.1 FO synthase subunit 2 [Methanococcus voltae]